LRIKDIDTYDLLLVISWKDIFRKILNRLKKYKIPIAFFAVGCFYRNKKFQPNRFPYLTSFNEQLYDGDFIYDEILPSDRWDKLNIKLKPWKMDGNFIVVAHQHFNYFEKDRVRIFKKVISRLIDANQKIIIRFHPAVRKEEFKSVEPYKNIKNVKISIGDHPVEDDLKDAKCLITYDSTICVDSLINGIPIILYGEQIAKCMASPNIHDLKYPDRQPWFNWLAYQHWDSSELCTKQWFDYYKSIDLIKDNYEENSSSIL